MKAAYRKSPSPNHWGYDLTVTLTLTAEEAARLLGAAHTGCLTIAERCPSDGMGHQVPGWMDRAAEFNALYHEVERRQKEGESAIRPDAPPYALPASDERTEDLARALSMKPGQNSIRIHDRRFVLVRLNRTTWRLGEASGDWLTHGTAEELIARAYRDAQPPAE